MWLVYVLLDHEEFLGKKNCITVFSYTVHYIKEMEKGNRITTTKQILNKSILMQWDF